MTTQKLLKRPDQEFIDLIVRSGHPTDRSIALAAQAELAEALQEPLRQGILVGDIATGIFESRLFAPGAMVKFPLDLLNPGEEKDHVAYTNPGGGLIPQRTVEGDTLMVPTYGITGSIDWYLEYAFEANWDVVGRAMQVLEASFVKKLNDDGWHTILGAVADRNILVFDSDATAGQFTKRLVSLLKTIMVRHGGGNTASLRRARLTDLYVSPEALDDIRNWGIDQVDELTRREIFMAPDGGVNRVFQVNLHDLVEFGEGQEYQNYFTDTLGGSLAASDVELVIGLDLLNNDSFLMPVKQEVTIFEDPGLHRQQKAGFYGWGNFGFAVLDQRRCVAGSF